ncbi:MAG: zinc-ribbon domain-containing protein [Dinoroseobacter sp.]|nr:zinc-ribbon domain-containing protein [Dinoroseobacter sp.]
MRLVCPNCSAEYEVDVSVIPAEGRDVQCSNCAHTWFEPHPDEAKAPAKDAENAAGPAQSARPKRIQPRVTVTRAEELNNPQPAPQPEPQRRSRVAAERAARAQVGSTPVTEDDPALRPAPKRNIDPNVLQVLREEAEHEASLRRGETPEPIESQSELALAGAAPSQSRRTSTDPRDVPDDELVPSGTIGPRRVTRSGRKEMLPDIEEINSSLRASTDRKTSVPAYVEVEERLKKVRRGQGFRMGFSLVMIVAAIGIFVYAFTPEISARVPQAEPFLGTYVVEVNKARSWLDTTVQSLSNQISELIAENS